MRIHKEGTPFIIVAALLGLIVSEISYLYLNRVGFIIVLACMLSVFTLVIFFFRNPVARVPQTDEKGILAPADGTIVAIEKVEEPEYFKGERLQVSIFMSIYNVHKNFVPITGTVAYYRHHSGNYHRAILPKSSVENERSSIVIKGQNVSLLMRQVAGAMARRVVSYLEEGDELVQGQELGFIKFGSRVDLFLPPDTELCVSLGDKTIGSQTLIAKLD